MDLHILLNPEESASLSRSAKKRKLRNGETMTVVRPTCHLARLPLELLADVLSYMRTPKEVLALSRCSKYFCATLVGNPAASFIWRDARQRCVPTAIPEPTQNFTESSYAAFIFDGGKCDTCGKHSKLMYHSFALRARVCRSTDCLKKWRAEKLTSTFVDQLTTASWTVCAEASLVYQKTTSYGERRYWPTVQHNYLVKDLKKNQMDADNAVDHTEEFNARIENVLKPRLNAIMEHAVALFRWKERYIAEFQRIQQANSGLGKEIAVRAGWKEWDMVQTPTFSALQRHHNNELTLIPVADLDAAKTEITLELEDTLRARLRREDEANRRRKQDVVRTWYARTRSAPGAPLLPSLPTFRALPLPAQLEKFDGTGAQLDEELLRNAKSVTARLLETALDQWRADVRKALAVKLGSPPFPEYPWMTQELHPVDRLDARFVCTKCHGVASKYKEDGCLDLAGVCHHECAEPSKKKRARHKWDVQQFAPAERAIKAITQALTLSKIDPARKRSADQVRALPARFLCNSCPARIVMDFKHLIGHSERHADMRISLLSEPEAESVLAQPLEMGLCRALADKAFKTRKELAKKVYGCRHCAQSVPDTEDVVQPPSDSAPVDAPAQASHELSTLPISAVVAAPEDGTPSTLAGQNRTQKLKAVESQGASVQQSKKRKLKKDRLWDWNGVSSHVKEKHGFGPLRDEDVYRVVI